MVSNKQGDCLVGNLLILLPLYVKWIWLVLVIFQLIMLLLLRN